MHRVFVYGTLRRGEAEAPRLRTATYLGRHITEPKYTLCDFEEYPAAVSWGLTQISGEVYEISDELLCELDAYEEYPKVYHRRQIPTAFGTAWIYLMRAPPAVACVIAHGDWCRRDEIEIF